MTTLDKLLTFLAACLGVIAVADPIGVPTWVQGTAVVLTIGFAAIGIHAPEGGGRMGWKN